MGIESQTHTMEACVGRQDFERRGGLPYLSFLLLFSSLLFSSLAPSLSLSSNPSVNTPEHPLFSFGFLVCMHTRTRGTL